MMGLADSRFGPPRRIVRVSATVGLILLVAFAANPGDTSVPRFEESASAAGSPFAPGLELRGEAPSQPSHGYVPPAIDLDHVKPIQPAQVRSTALPGRFDWRDKSKVTPIRNQNPCGTCWIFGTIASLESAVLIGEDTPYDFSEQSVALCVDRSWTYLYDDQDDPCMSGGNSLIAADTLTKRGAALENCSSYDPSGLRCGELCACDSCPPQKRVDGYRLVTNDGANIEIVKNALFEHGPLIVSFHYDRACEYTDGEWGTIYDCYPNPDEANHCVSIVGWDDAVPHPNPNHSGMGAWIVKNSWGMWHGEDGYAYLAYNAGRMVEVGYLGYQDHDPSEELLYWDEAGLVWLIAATNDSGWMANVFTAKQRQLLTHVEFWTTSTNAQYEIYVWDDRFGSELAHQPGTAREFGYYSVPIKPPVPLKAGQDFTIGVRMTTPGYGHPLAGEGPSQAAGVNPPIQNNVSFFRDDQWSPWQDLSENELNACLRARVSDDIANRPPVIAQLPDLTVAMDDATDDAIDLWAYADDREDSDAQLSFRVSNAPTPAAGINIDGRYLDVVPSAGFTGTTEVIVEVRDTQGLNDTDSLIVTVRRTDRPQEVFLPFVLRVNLLNGSFEGGVTGWRVYSTNGRDIISTRFPTGVIPRDGLWAAWLGEAVEEQSAIEQSLIVPPERPVLTYWQWIQSHDLCGWDIAGVTVGDSTVVYQVDLCEAENTGGWVKRAVDLSSYVGQPIRLRIWAQTDDWLESNLFVDDVRFAATSSAGNE